MRILYIGSRNPASNCYLRSCALERIGCLVERIDPKNLLPQWAGGRFAAYVNYRTGYQLVQRSLEARFNDTLKKIASNDFDLVWVSSGELIGPGIIQLLKTVAPRVVLYNEDDPTGRRDGQRFFQVKHSLKHYELCVIRIEKPEVEFHQLGARNLLKHYLEYDEVAHAPFADREKIPAHLRSEVAFIGTWMRGENRDRFLLELINRGVPVAIWGGHWEKSPIFNSIKPFYRGGPVLNRDYVAAIQGAKVCLGMLSKQNRDQHTRRSVEVPFAGGLLCAERTAEHLNLYEEGKEALFWNDANECASICLDLLQSPQRVDQIRAAGRKRILELKLGNEDLCRRVLAELNLNKL